MWKARFAVRGSLDERDRLWESGSRVWLECLGVQKYVVCDLYLQAVPVNSYLFGKRNNYDHNLFWTLLGREEHS